MAFVFGDENRANPIPVKHITIMIKITDVLSSMREYKSKENAQIPIQLLASTDGLMRSERLPVKGESSA